MTEQQQWLAGVAAVALLALAPALAQQEATASAPTVAVAQDELQLDRSLLERIEQRLQEAGHELERVDGDWSGQSTLALQAFQRKAGLEANGKLDAQTLNALGVAPGS